MSKVLITGVAGLLGSNFANYLLRSGHDVVGVDNLSGGFLENVPEGVNFRSFDLLDHTALEHLFFWEKPDYVYHFAAYAAEGLSPFIRNYNYQNNVIASINVINACINFNVKKLIFTSSMAVYGEGKPPYTEEQAPCPVDPYGVAKYAVEMDLRVAYEQFGLNYSIVRPHNVIGIKQNIWDRYRNVIGIWIRQVMSEQPITIYGDGTQIRSFSDIDFYMEPFAKLMDGHNGKTFNIGADNHVTINEAASVLKQAAKRFGYNVQTVHLEKRDEVHSAYCDHTKAKEALGFVDNTHLEDTIYKMFQWAATQPSRQVKTLNYEIEKGIYSYWKKN